MKTDQSRTMHGLMINDDAFHRWQTVAGSQKLKTDSEVAHFLINLYEKPDIGIRCESCRGPQVLIMHCPSCNRTAQQTKSVPSERHSCDSIAVDAASSNKTESPSLVSEQVLLDADDKAAGNADDDTEAGDADSSVDGEVGPTEKDAPQKQVPTRTSPRRAKPSPVKVRATKAKVKSSSVELEATIPKSTSNQVRTRSAAKKSNGAEQTKSLGSKERRFGCTICQQRFVGKNDLRRHLRKHTGEKPFECAECGLTFTLAKSLRDHKLRRACERVLLRAARKQAKQISSRGRPSATSLAPEQQSGDTGHTESEDSRGRPSATSLAPEQQSGDTGHTESEDSHGRPVASLSPEQQSDEFGHTENGDRQSAGRPSLASLAHEKQSSNTSCTKSEDKKRRHVCKVCQRRFLGTNDLKRHMRTHTGEKPNVCLVCGAAFSLSHTLRQHVRRHMRDKPETVLELYPTLSTSNTRSVKSADELAKQQAARTEDGRYACEVCTKPFVTYKDLTIHMRKHTGEKPYVCEKCGKKFAYAHSLKTHERVHSGKKTFFCEECGLGFFDAEGLQKHMLLHTGERPYLCDECGGAYTTPSTLRNHIINVHVGEKPHVCDICRAAFKTFRQLSVHSKLHSGDENPYKCTECGEGFPSTSALKQHRNTHAGRVEFKCKQCESVFKTSNLLLLHVQKTHMDSYELSEESGATSAASDKLSAGAKDADATGPFACGACKVVVETAAEWTVHLTSHANKNQCSTCGAAFSTGFKLREHVRIHTGERPFICSVCNARFRTKAHLKVHMRSHTGYKPHVCEVCNKAFSMSANLQLHMRRHTGERPYGCQYCCLAFTQRCSLQRHMKTHSGERPFVCEMCGGCFASAGALKRHMHTHKQAGDKIITCSKCAAVFTIPANIQTGAEEGEIVTICENCIPQEKATVVISDSVDASQAEVIEITLVNC